MGVYETSRELFSSLAGLLCTCVAVDAFFIFCELLTMMYPGSHGAVVILTELTQGATAPFFWFEIICGLVIPFCILVFSKNRQNKRMVNIACMLIVVGVFCKRIWLLFTAFITPNVMGAPGIISGSERGSSSNWHELVRGSELLCTHRHRDTGVCGVVALVILGFMVLVGELVVKRGGEE